MFKFIIMLFFITITLNVQSSEYFENLSCGYSHCYKIENGEVWAIGSNVHGQLSLGNKKSTKYWINTGFKADKVVAGFYHGYALRNGEIWVVGDNSFGQLVFKDKKEIPNWVNTEIDVSYASAGTLHAYVIRHNEIWSIGYNKYGQLGLGNNENQDGFVINPARHFI